MDILPGMVHVDVGVKKIADVGGFETVLAQGDVDPKFGG